MSHIPLPKLPSNVTSNTWHPLVNELLLTEHLFIKDMQKTSFALGQLGGRSVSLKQANQLACVDTLRHVIAFHQECMKQVESVGPGIEFVAIAEIYISRVRHCILAGR